MTDETAASDRAQSVTEALRTRHSCRAFLARSVSGDLVRSIVDAARAAPSGGNLQPWQVYVLAHQPLADFRARLAPRIAANPLGEGAGYDVYPPNVREPYRSRP